MELKDDLTYENESMQYTTLREWRIKPHYQLDAEKALDKIEHSFADKKKTQQTRNRRKVPPHNKGHICKAHSYIILNGKNWNLSF